MKVKLSHEVQTGQKGDSTDVILCKIDGHEFHRICFDTKINIGKDIKYLLGVIQRLVNHSLLEESNENKENNNDQ